MKRFKIYVIVLVFTVLASAKMTEAQIQIGAVGGLNMSNFIAHKDNPFGADPDDFHQQTAFGAGAAFEVALMNHVSIHTELLFIQKRSEYLEELEEHVIYTLSYLELPLFVKVGFGRRFRPYVFGGPSIGFVLAANAAFDQGAASWEADVIDIAERIDIGIGFGAGVSYNLGMATVYVEGRYAAGLRNINQGGTFQVDLGGFTIPITVDALELVTVGKQIMGGVMIPVGGRR